MLYINGLSFNSFPQYKLYLDRLDNLQLGRISLPDNSILYFSEINIKFIKFIKKLYGIDCSPYLKYQYGKFNPWKSFSYYYNQIENDLQSNNIIKLALFHKNEFLISSCTNSIDFLYKENILLTNSKNRKDYISKLLIAF